MDTNMSSQIEIQRESFTTSLKSTLIQQQQQQPNNYIIYLNVSLETVSPPCGQVDVFLI